MKRIFLALQCSTFLLCCIELYAQNSCLGPSGIPDYYEAEDCFDLSPLSGLIYSNDPVLPGNSLLDLSSLDVLDVPQAGSSLHVRGNTRQFYYLPLLVPGFWAYGYDVDNYQFVLTETTELRFVTRRSTANDGIYLIIQKFPDVLATDASASFIMLPNLPSFYINSYGSNCTYDEGSIPSYTLAPGFYNIMVSITDPGTLIIGDDFLTESEKNAMEAQAYDLTCIQHAYDYDLVIHNLNEPVDPPCTNAVSITHGPTFANFEETGATETIASNSPTQCVGSGNHDEKWYKFEPVTSNSYIRVWGNGDFDAVVEVFDGCTGNLIKCQNEVGPGDREIVILPGLNLGQTYYYRTYHAGATPPTNNTFLTSGSHIPLIKLLPTQCNKNLIEGVWVVSTQPASTYLLVARKWRFTETAPPYNSYEYTVSGTSNRINWSTFAEREVGRSYTVEVKTRQYQDALWGEYWTACVVHYPMAGIIQYQEEFATAENWFTLSPNPGVGEELNVSYSINNDKGGPLNLVVYDMAGRLVYETNIQDGRSGYTVAYFDQTLSTGLYIAKLYASDGTQLTEKFVVK